METISIQTPHSLPTTMLKGLFFLCISALATACSENTRHQGGNETEINTMPGTGMIAYTKPTVCSSTISLPVSGYTGQASHCNVQKAQEAAAKDWSTSGACPHQSCPSFNCQTGGSCNSYPANTTGGNFSCSQTGPQTCNGNTQKQYECTFRPGISMVCGCSCS